VRAFSIEFPRCITKVNDDNRVGTYSAAGGDWLELTVVFGLRFRLYFSSFAVAARDAPDRTRFTATNTVFPSLSKAVLCRAIVLPFSPPEGRDRSNGGKPSDRKTVRKQWRKVPLTCNTPARLVSANGKTAKRTRPHVLKISSSRCYCTRPARWQFRFDGHADGEIRIAFCRSSQPNVIRGRSAPNLSR